MPRVLVVVFWCWFAVSMFILLRRGVRKVSGHGAPSAPAEATPRREWPPLHEIDPLAVDDGGRPATVADAGETGETSGAAAPIPERGVFGHPASRTIATALDGIRLPCELTPLMGPSIDLDRRAAFYTVGYPAEAVAPEIADELERIGMEFNPVSDNVALARRDDVQVRVAVRALGPAINGVADDTYPGAPANSVVVEFELA